MYVRTDTRRPSVRRWLTALLGALVLLVPLGWIAQRFFKRTTPIRIGILHSQSGPIAISERSMIDAEIMAIEEINANGGVLHRPLEPVIADGQSDFRAFAREAARLIVQEKVSVIFGCWASASRKSVKPIIEQYNHLLFYPNAYEGLEQSPNIVYTGAAPNQQVIPAISWCFETLKARRFFLVGSDYVWARCVNEIVKDQLKALGAKSVGDSYVLFGSGDVKPAIEAIEKARPDMIISTVVGDSNKAFYLGLQSARITPQKTPVLAFGIAEDEIRELPLGAMIGDYAAWDYFQAIDRPENLEFVRRFQKRFGAHRVTSDVIEAAYNSVNLWAQAVEDAETEDVTGVLKMIKWQSLNAPEGIVSVDAETQHTWRPVYVGRIRADGQFDLVWSSEQSVRPIPYPPSRSKADWERFLDQLYQGWGGWANPGTASGSTPSDGGVDAAAPAAREGAVASNARQVGAALPIAAHRVAHPRR
jgi:urea transport system substrate-binding protein